MNSNRSAHARADDFASPDRRRRSPQTRARILEGAQRCFLDRGFAATTVEEIVATAGLSRATFYLHYNGKTAVLVDLLAQHEAPMRQFFRRLCDMDRPDRASVRGWLEAYVRKLRRNRDLLTLFHMGAGDTAARDAVTRHRRAMIDVLAERFAAFRYDDEDPDRQARGYARSLIRLMPVEQMVSDLAHGGFKGREAQALDVLTDHLLGILQDD